MQFQQTAVPGLYAPQDAPAAGPALYLLLPAGTPSPPAALGLADSWTAHPAGAYLFLPAPLEAGEEAAFATAARAFLDEPSLKRVRFAWLAGPTPASGRLTGTTAAVWKPAPGAWATSRSTRFEFRNLALFLAPGASVAVEAGEDAFTFGAAGAPPARLIAGWGGAPLPAVARGPLRLPLTGSLAGCLCFPATLARTENAPDVDTLDVGFRYFYGNPALAGDDGSFFMDSLRWRLLATERRTLALYAALDPLAPLHARRTFLAFWPGDAGLAGPAPAEVPSYFRSTLGEPLSLRPQTGTSAPTGFARLVFAEQPAPSPPGPAEPYTLVPRGDFEVRGANDLLCGLSGVEHVALGGTGDLLSFRTGKTAYAPGFFPGTAPGTVRLEGSSPPGTSHAAVSRRGGSADYYAQPDASVLFNYAAAQPAGVTTVPELAPQQVLAATLPYPPAVEFPLFPYAGAEGRGEALPPYAQLEAEVVSPLRRALLAEWPPLPRTQAQTLPASQYSATPQGLLATYTPGSATWDEVVLAEMAATGDQLRLDDVTGQLLSAFRSNELFLVVSDPATLQGVLTANASTVQIGADPAQLWAFSLDPAHWAQFGTVLVLKYCSKSIRELLGQTTAWAFPDTFNASPTATAATLAAAIDGADPADPRYAAFLRAATDPAWNGILALNVRAPLDELPAQLAGLAAGIDPAAFFAHHVGITASRLVVPATPADLSVTDPSIFGLLDYRAPGPLPRTGAVYQFQVRQLAVLFLNSAVADFSSRIELEMNALFAASATLRGAPLNVVEMTGVYQTHQSNGRTTESYVFRTPAGASSDFELEGGVLDALGLAGGEFATVSPTRPYWPLAAAGGAARAGGTVTLTTAEAHGLGAGDRVRVSRMSDAGFDGFFTVASVPSTTTLTYAQAGTDATATGGRVAAAVVRSRFTFRGVMDFHALAGFDLFSFGSEPAAPPADPDEEVPAAPPVGLRFANLGIGMDFSREQDPLVPAFAFDAGALSLDPAGSTARAGSFFGHFPLELAGLAQGAAGSTPADGGFLSVQTPLAQGTLQSPWFSLVFNLDLGSPGGLAAQMDFTATLVAAWSPGGDGAEAGVYVGLRLPGSSGARRAVRIQEIFDLTFRSLAIVSIPASDTYVLVLYGIAFEYLGFAFPPVGRLNFSLFGNPAEGGAGKTLGWYAAYAKPAQRNAAGASSASGTSTQSLTSGAPALPSTGEG